MIDWEQARELELDRLAEASATLAGKIAAGDYGEDTERAVAALNKLNERRSKILGFAKPEAR